MVTVSFFWIVTGCDPGCSSKYGVYWSDHPLEYWVPPVTANELLTIYSNTVLGTEELEKKAEKRNRRFAGPAAIL